MQPIPKMHAIATFARRFIRKFQIKSTGSSPTVKSVMAAPTLYTYAMAMRISVLIQLPGLENRFQKKLTG